MCPCGQGTEAGVGVTRPALWPSCQAVCILELTRAEGGAPGPVRLITGGQRPWGGPGSNGSPDWGHGLHHGEAVSCLLMPPSPASHRETRAGAARRAGRAPRGPVPILSVELGWEQTESTAMLQALVTARLWAVPQAVPAGKGGGGFPAPAHCCHGEAWAHSRLSPAGAE